MAYRGNFSSCLCLLSISAFCGGAAAATLSLAGEQITIEGRLMDGDVDRFVELTYGKPIRRVIFRASSGGQWRAGQRLGNLLMGKNITTVVEGVCASSCAMAFLGGDKREYATTSDKNVLIFHAPYLPGQTQPLATLKQPFFDWIALRTGKVVPPDFRAAVEQVNTPDGGVFFFSDGAGELTTWICRGDEAVFPKGCPKATNLSPREMGLIN